MKNITFCLLLSVGAFAQSTTNTTKASSKTSGLSKLAPSQVTYFSVVSPRSPGAEGRYDEFGNLKETGISAWNQVSFRWQLSENIRLDINPRFTINEHHRKTDAGSFELVDPVFGITSTWYENGNFSFGGGLNTITPLTRTQDTADSKLLFNPGGFNSATYKVNEDFSFGSWVWGRYKIYEGNGNDSGKNVFSYQLAPLMTFTFSDKASVTTFYEINGVANDGSRDLFIQKKNDSLNLMGSYEINSALSISPIFTLYRNSKYDFEKANLSFWLSGRLF